MSVVIRTYQSQDYQKIIALYKQSDLYGGNFDEARDAKEKLQKRIENDPDAILIAEEDGKMMGTVSLIEDGRVAWLFRFCVSKNKNENTIAEALFDKAKHVLKAKGHTQVLVYTPANNQKLANRYEALAFTKGADYTCFWKEL